MSGGASSEEDCHRRETNRRERRVQNILSRRKRVPAKVSDDLGCAGLQGDMRLFGFNIGVRRESHVCKLVFRFNCARNVRVQKPDRDVQALSARWLSELTAIGDDRLHADHRGP